MLSNLHTHSTFCDGKNTPEEMVEAALALGFVSLGFSGHAYTPYSSDYCMKNTDGYCAEIRRLQEAYRGRIEIYLGLEEDAFYPADRSRYDYIIGSAHYVRSGGTYFSVDSSRAHFDRSVQSFNGDFMQLAENYYQNFVTYILDRKPDIVGHFDLPTKFDEGPSPMFLQNEAYHRLAERSIEKAAQSGCLFEVNTGAISRGYRTTPYPHERLLWVLKKHDVGLVLTSDCHAAEALCCHFEESRALLRSVGFDHVWVLHGGKFEKDSL